MLGRVELPAKVAPVEHRIALPLFAPQDQPEPLAVALVIPVVWIEKVIGPVVLPPALFASAKTRVPLAPRGVFVGLAFASKSGAAA